MLQLTACSPNNEQTHSLFDKKSLADGFISTSAWSEIVQVCNKHSKSFE